MIDLIVTLAVGALIGWLASMIMNTDQDQGALANIIIGIVGSALGRWLFAGLLGLGGAAAAGEFSLIGLFWGIVGAVVLIAILKFFRVFGRTS